MPKVTMEELMRKAIDNGFTERPFPLDDIKYVVRKIVGHRTGPRIASEYKIIWGDSELEEIEILAGTINDRPIIHDVNIAYWCPITKVYTVGWNQSWLPAECILDCGELLHDFWLQFFKERTSHVRTLNINDVVVRVWETAAQ